ncbi:DUF6132 family protein [Pedobacter arcticus]|uniref:DUF6132 family protein n=1 Tax=Pedobacter arcticus TaxID=752140 RepID=UPI0003198981|nr:DUF6132 family protein [Pedobacter arcticus]
MKFLINNKLVFLGIVIGSIAGYAYYHFVGCTTGTCSITSKPLNSTLYGAIMGGILFIGDNKSKAQKNKEEDEN